jgi:serine protease
VTLKDNDATGVNGSLQLADSKQIRGLKVSVNIAHTYVGALNVELRHGAVRATLSASEGGDATELVKTFDVTAFNGQESGGAWELWVIDTDAYGDSGKLNSWKLEIEY